MKVCVNYCIYDVIVAKDIDKKDCIVLIMADRFALFIWINDDPIRGNVLRISTIVEPRQSYEDYAVGQKVIVKCPRMGKFDAVIGKICGKKFVFKHLNQTFVMLECVSVTKFLFLW